MKGLFALVMALSVASLASASIITVSHDGGSPAPGAAGLTVFQVYLACPAGYIVTGFDGRFDGDMNQVWAWGVTRTPVMDNLDLYDQDMEVPVLRVFTQQDKDRDSHIVLHYKPWDGGSGELLWVHPMPSAIENAAGMAENPSGPSEATGTWLAGSSGTAIVTVPLGFVPSVQGRNVHLAQIVIPDGSGGVLISGSVSMAEFQWMKTSVDPDPEVWEWLISGQYSDEPLSFIVPEPATLGLLTVGACGLFLRRRRQRRQR